MIKIIELIFFFCRILWILYFSKVGRYIQYTDLSIEKITSLNEAGFPCTDTNINIDFFTVRKILKEPYSDKQEELYEAIKQCRSFQDGRGTDNC